jgi:ribonuclease BN (tRNA processing enzyme)
MKRRESVSRRARRASAEAPVVEFDVWGARGSRSLSPPLSTIANYTSCYSIRAGRDLFVLDGGRGLGVLSHHLSGSGPFSQVDRIHLLLSHSHMDHWEGLKDAVWFWNGQNGLKLEVLGAAAAISAVHRGYGHPAYVPLEVLAERTLRQLSFSELDVGERRRVDGWTIQTYPLNHYSGAGRHKNRLDTLGFRLRSPQGFVLSYLCDHEPTEETTDDEERMLRGAQLAVVDAHFADRSQHAYGHGSQEHAAQLARSHPETLVLAGHHGPIATDREIRRAKERHGKGLPNYALAEEGLRISWSASTKRLRTGRRR